MKKLSTAIILTIITCGIAFAVRFGLPIPGVYAQVSSFNFTAAGDHGAPGQTDTKKSLQTILSSGASYHLALGDMSYSDSGTEPTDNQTPSPWCTGTDANKNIKLTIGDAFPFQMISGNHEEDGGPDGRIGNFALCLPDRMNSVGKYGAEYYFDYPQNAPLVRNIMVAADLNVQGVFYDYNAGTHRTWLINAIDDARAKGIPWVVVGMHKNCTSMGNKTGCSIGKSAMDLLISKKVDLILQAHDHDYQRGKQLSCVTQDSYSAGCVVDDGSDNQYVKDRGPVLVIQGMFGGGGFTPMTCTDPERFYFAKGMGGDGNVWNGSSCVAAGVGKGLMKYTVTSDRIDARFVMSEQSISGTPFSDSFSIVKDPNAPPSSPAPTPVVSPSPTPSPLSSPTPTPTPSPSPTPIGCSNTLPTNTGQASTTFTADLATSYKVWSRVMSAGDSSDSFWLQIDNNCPINVGDRGGTSVNTWNWIDYKDGQDLNKVVVPLTAGSHTVRAVGREAGLKLDRLLITADLLCVPTGTGDNCVLASPSPSPSAVVSPTPSVLPTPTPSPTPSAGPSPSPSPSPLPSPSPTPPGGIATLSFGPSDDDTIREKDQSDNFGSNNRLEVDNSTMKRSMLKFNVSGVSGKKVVSARLRLYVVDSSPFGGRFWRVLDNSWTEKTLTWKNQPPTDGDSITSLGDVDSGRWYEVDLTSYVVGDGTYSLKITSPESNGVDFSSKEGTNPPQLILTVQ